jgi:predicted transcriptional regulator
LFRFSEQNTMTELTIADLRKELGLSLEAFAVAIGIASKGNASLIERDNRASLPVALAIEALSIKDGVARIDAATLNADVAKARAAQAGVEPAAICHGADACATVGDSEHVAQNDGGDAAAQAPANALPQNGSDVATAELAA